MYTPIGCKSKSLFQQKSASSINSPIEPSELNLDIVDRSKGDDSNP